MHDDIYITSVLRGIRSFRISAYCFRISIGTCNSKNLKNNGFIILFEGYLKDVFPSGLLGA